MYIILSSFHQQQRWLSWLEVRNQTAYGTRASAVHIFFFCNFIIQKIVIYPCNAIQIVNDELFRLLFTLINPRIRLFNLDGIPLKTSKTILILNWLYNFCWKMLRMRFALISKSLRKAKEIQKIALSKLQLSKY